VRALWREERVDYDGEYYKTIGATLYDRPEEGIPIYVAGGPTMARYAGRVAEGFICTSGKGMDLYEEKLMPAVDEGIEKAQRDPSEVDRLIEIKLSFDTDYDTALENTRFWAPLALSPEQKAELEDPIEMERAA